MSEHPSIAALVYSTGEDPTVVLAEIVRTLAKRGIPLAGVIQHHGGPCLMELELLPSGRRVPISQKLGNGTRGCRLDTSAMAEAASLVRAALDASPALAVFNKFGAQEASGGGLRDEMIAAITSGVPVLTVVKSDLLDQWNAFTGNSSIQLPCTTAAALAWWSSVEG